MISDKYKVYNPYTQEVIHNLRLGQSFRGDLSRHCTGLKDRNGVDIYYGDILNWTTWYEELTPVPDVYLVDWDKKYARYYFIIYRDGQILEEDELNSITIKQFEVVGSIDTTPELLK